MKAILYLIGITLCACLGMFAPSFNEARAQTATCVGSSVKECFPLPGQPSSYTWTSYLKGACLNDDCTKRATKDHVALDIGATTGTPVFSPWDGVVEISERYPGSTNCGAMVQIVHSAVQKRSYMCHFQEPTVSVGAQVKAGDIVGLANNSGESFGSHLHIQILDTLSGAPLREQQIAALPAFRGINSGGVGGGANGKPIFITSNEGRVPQASDIKLNLELDWPRLPGTDKSLNELTEGGAKIYIQNLVNFIFIFALWISAVVAFVTVVYAGFAYIISGANPGERSKAIQGIKNTVIGIGILLSSVIILNFINPNLTSLQLGLSLSPKALELIAPTAPTASGGQLKNTTDHPYAPLPFTNRSGAEDTYAALLVKSDAIQECFKKAGSIYDFKKKCERAHEAEIVARFKSANGIIVKDDDDTQISCAAVCMKQSGTDPLNCRQYGSGGGKDGGAKAIWNKLQTEKWGLTSEGYYGQTGSPNNEWLIDNSEVPGDEDQASRACLASYVSEAMDAPGDFGWDVCMCNANPVR